MKLSQFSLVALAAIATIGSTQSAALSQSKFKNPTHPTLSEITRSESNQMPATSSQSTSLEQFKVPTRPTLSEITPSQGNQTEGMKPQPQPQASRLQSGGQTFFSHLPRLTRVNASQKTPYLPSTYEFTLVVPADAGASLKAVTIVQEKNLETIDFDISRSKAFAGERYAAGPELPLASIGGAQPAPGEVTIVFDQPVQPGTTVTVALEAQANPAWGGVYEFGVTAFPTGEQTSGQFLGYQRINFYTGGS